MAEFDFNDLVAQAEAAGGGPTSSWEDGQYKMTVARSKTSKTKSGLPSLDILWTNDDDNYVGQTNWENININKENNTSVSIFINKLIALGIEKEFLKTNPPLEQVAAMLEGVTALVDFKTKPWKSDPSRTSLDFRVKKLIDLDLSDDESSDPAENSEGGIFG